MDSHVLQWCDLLEPVPSSSLVEYLGPLGSASIALATVWQARPWWERKGVEEPCLGEVIPLLKANSIFA